MATMKHLVNRSIFLGRALRSNSTAICGGFTGGSNVPYGTCSSYSSQWQPLKLVDRLSLSNPYSAHSVRFGSSAATSLAQDLQSNASVRSEESFKPMLVVLFQYEACPLCNKVIAFMDYYDIPYIVVEVNPLHKKEIEWSNYKNVPILTVDGQQMVDSSEMIDKMVKRIRPNYDLDADEEKKWREWVDNHLIHVVASNIWREISIFLEMLDFITAQGIFNLSETFWVNGYVAICVIMFKIFAKILDISNDDRVAWRGAAEQWVDALKGRKFLGGLDPNLADLAVFGVLRPIRHLMSGIDMEEYTRIRKWYSRVGGTMNNQ